MTVFVHCDVSPKLKYYTFLQRIFTNDGLVLEIVGFPFTSSVIKHIAFVRRKKVVQGSSDILVSFSNSQQLHMQSIAGRNSLHACQASHASIGKICQHVVSI